MKKQSQVKKIVGTIIILLAALFFIICEFSGYKYYYEAVLSIESASAG
jgi:hypothetical protein